MLQVVPVASKKKKEDSRRATSPLQHRGSVKASVSLPHDQLAVVRGSFFVSFCRALRE